MSGNNILHRDSVFDLNLRINTSPLQLVSWQVSEQAIEYLIYFRYGGAGGAYEFIFSQEDYLKRIDPKNCEENVQPPVKAITVTERKDIFIVEMNLQDYNNAKLRYEKFKVSTDGKVELLDKIILGECHIII